MTLLLGVSSAAHGTAATFEAKGDLYTLDTGHLTGECHVLDRGSAGVDVDCYDDDGHRAFGNSKLGCITTSHGGTCRKGPRLEFKSAVMLTCGKTDYVIGTKSEGTICQVTYDVSGHAESGVCDDREKSSAKVDCSKNKGEGACDRTTGSGGCLMP